VQQATAAAQQATGAVRADPQNGPAVAHATADLLTALSAVTRRSRTPVPWVVSDTFDRAARTPMLRQPRRWPPVAQELRRAAWRLAAARSVSRGREDDSGMAELMVAVAALVAEIAAYHEERRCLAQAAAARRTGRVLPRPSTGGGRRGAEPARTPPTRGGPRRPATAVTAAAAAAVTPAAVGGPAVGRGPGGVGDTGPRQGRSR
jgi:hypothetical protein